ncbi:Hypothetical_protein [Hexamita inflata]|uniref:Hypothetical_protein n=1 Tax=Hexamita inflata TaxID=28002 RepID=A0AA86V659_9EUKA|nr:Hypothetical protein HINF_LOCUS65477 [Hexamita inflata]
MNQYTKLQQLYLNDLDLPGAVQFKEFSQQQYFSKTSKVIQLLQCCQFLNKELMSELYVRTNLILDVLENQSKINSFGTTTNTVECEFGLTKNLCNGKQELYLDSLSKRQTFIRITTISIQFIEKSTHTYFKE